MPQLCHGIEWPILCWCAVKQLLTHLPTTMQLTFSTTVNDFSVLCFVTFHCLKTDGWTKTRHSFQSYSTLCQSGEFMWKYFLQAGYRRHQSTEGMQRSVKVFHQSINKRHLEDVYYNNLRNGQQISSYHDTRVRKLQLNIREQLSDSLHEITVI